MKIIPSLLVILLLTALGGESNKVFADDKKSTVKATMADKQFQAEVLCVGRPDQKFFEFMSDMPKGPMSFDREKDITGDGLVIRGWMYNARMPDGSKKQKFGLKIIENGIEYMNADLKSWEKTASGVTGSGELKKQQDDFADLPASFEVTCK